MDFYKLILKSNTVIISKAPPVNGGWTFSHVFLLMFVPSRANTGISPIDFRAKKSLDKYLGLAGSDRASQKGAAGVQNSPHLPGRRE